MMSSSHEIGDALVSLGERFETTLGKDEIGIDAAHHTAKHFARGFVVVHNQNVRSVKHERPAGLAP